VRALFLKSVKEQIVNLQRGGNLTTNHTEEWKITVNDTPWCLILVWVAWEIGSYTEEIFRAFI